MINKDEYDSFDGYVDALEAKVEEYDKFMLWLDMHSATEWKQLYESRIEREAEGE